MCDLVNVCVRAKGGDEITMPLLTVPTICEPICGQPITLASRRYPYLSVLDLADRNDTESHLDVGILIGADLYWSMVTGRTRQGNGPTAIETKLGWVLSGPATGLSCESTSMSLLTLDDTLKKFWDLETIGIKTEESSVYEEFMQNIVFRDGRYCVHLPWKGYHPPLPDNFNLCQTRLFGLIRRLRQSPHILREYDNIIQDQISKGIVEIVEDPWTPSKIGKLHYLPHHGVIREDKATTKFRIVYDASARTTGPSLNNCLYAGPSFGQRIADILARFRIYPVGLIADIEKAFLMVSVADEDRDVLRFLWLDDVNSELPRIKILRFAQVVFGVSSSPFLLNATIKHHMNGYKEVGEQFVEKFERSIYVDDVTFGACNEDEAFQLYKKAKCCLAKGAFNLRKFRTNCSELQRLIDVQECQGADMPPSDQKKTTADDESYVRNTLGDYCVNSSAEMVLGVLWDCTSDQLSFDIHHIYEAAKGVEPTKRIIIGIVSRFYDPLGVLSPFTVLFKMLFQKLCINKIDWDEPLLGELLSEWKKLVNDLKQVQCVIIPRCYFNMGEKRRSCSLIGFCDASLQAYAAVVYLRVKTDSGCYARFVAAKTRVSPLQDHSIPRLELLGGLLVSRLLASITSALKSELELDAPTFFTDSKVVLFWIQGHDKEWRQFVENRVREIRQLSSVEYWRHCPGRDNPADLPSRGIYLDTLANDPLWLPG